tara:strand:- start:522 stop:1499 length:978 start_codon:yes stop_codon:yes gene_type:complete
MRDRIAMEKIREKFGERNIKASLRELRKHERKRGVNNREKQAVVVSENQNEEVHEMGAASRDQRRKRPRLRKRPTLQTRRDDPAGLRITSEKAKRVIAALSQSTLSSIVAVSDVLKGDEYSCEAVEASIPELKRGLTTRSTLFMGELLQMGLLKLMSRWLAPQRINYKTLYPCEKVRKGIICDILPRLNHKITSAHLADSNGLGRILVSLLRREPISLIRTAGKEIITHWMQMVTRNHLDDFARGSRKTELNPPPIYSFKCKSNTKGEYKPNEGVLKRRTDREPKQNSSKSEICSCGKDKELSLSLLSQEKDIERTVHRYCKIFY